MKFLLVDDNQAERDLILSIVRQAFSHIEAVEAATRQELESTLRMAGIEVVLTAQRLGWGDGFEVLRAARERMPHRPVLMLAGVEDVEMAVKGMKLGLSDYLVKPQWHRLPQAMEESLAKAKFRGEFEVTLDQLRQSEERYRMVSELTSDCAFACRVEMDGQIVVEWVTEAFKRILGGHSETMRSHKDWSKWVYPEDLPIARRYAQKVLAGQFDNVEFRILLLSGEVRWMRHYAHPIWDEQQNRVVRVYGAAQDITARQRSEERLRQTTSELQAIFNALPDIYFRLDADGTILDYHAPKPSDLYLPPEAFLGQRMQAVLPPDVSLQIFQAILKVRKTGLLTRVEYELPLRNGLRRFEARLLPLREKQIIAVVRDITDSKHAEQALLRQERQLEALAKASQQVNTVLEVPVILRTMVSSAMALVDATAGMAGLLVDDEMIFSEYNRHDEWRPVQFRFNRGQGVAGHIIQSPLPYYANQAAQDDVVSKSLRQELALDNLACVPLLNRHGELLGCIELHNTVGRRPFDDHDIAMLQGLAASAAIALENAWALAARQRTEQALRQSEERFRRLFDSSPVGIMILREGHVVLANPACGRMFGGEPWKSIPPAAFDEFLGPQHRERVGAWLRRTVSEEDALGASELTGLRADGSPFPLYLELTHTELTDGPATVAFLTDLTERMSLEFQLRQAQKIEFIGQLSSGVAHDFNNILTIIQGHVDLMLAEDPLSPDMVESLQQVAMATGRASRLTQQLLAFSQKQPHRLARLNLNELIQQLTGILGKLLGETVTVDVACTPNLPDIQGDRGLMEQVLINLLVNARDAMPNGGHIKISTESRSRASLSPKAPREHTAQQFVCVCVADAGCGMDEAVQQHLFEPFFSTKGSGKGTGLGLAIVFGIIKQHQGWLEVSSQPGEGSTFEVFLPACEQEPPPPPQAKPDLTAAADPAQTTTILVVEDEEPLRFLVRTLLRRQGYQVLEAGSGIEALQIWAVWRDKINLLLTDIIMPEGLSGPDLARQLLTQKPSLKVIFASGYPQELEPFQGQSSFDTQVLLKPFQPPELLAKIHQCLGQSQTS